MHIEKRISDRTQVNWSARCFTSDEQFWYTTIVDASDGGFGFCVALPLNVGERLMIDIDGIGVFPCQIAWKREGRCGVVLLDENHCLSMEDVMVLDKALSDMDTFL